MTTIPITTSLCIRPAAARMLGLASVLIALFLAMTAPVFNDKISLTADYTATWAPLRYANASGHVVLIGKRSIWDKLSSPLRLNIASQTLRQALDASLAAIGPQLAKGSLPGPLWSKATLDRCTSSLGLALGGSWTAQSDDLRAVPTDIPPNELPAADAVSHSDGVLQPAHAAAAHTLAGNL